MMGCFKIVELDAPDAPAAIYVCLHVAEYVGLYRITCIACMCCVLHVPREPSHYISCTQPSIPRGCQIHCYIVSLV